MERVSIGVLLVVQFVCAAFFVYDIAANLLGLRTAPLAWAVYEMIEVGAALGLLLGVGVTAWMLAASLRARRRAESSLRLAQGAFMDVLEEHFAEWSLTAAERDVALMAIKGLSIAETARVRETSEGTVKAQTAAIYRKAGVSGRPQLLSLFIDDMMGDGLIARQKTGGDRTGGGSGPAPQDAPAAKHARRSLMARWPVGRGFGFPMRQFSAFDPPRPGTTGRDTVKAADADQAHRAKP